MVPHLTTALTGPINELEQRILESMPAVERWFRLEWMEHTPPFYCSVDIRNAGFKLAPVDDAATAAAHFRSSTTSRPYVPNAQRPLHLHIPANSSTTIPLDADRMDIVPMLRTTTPLGPRILIQLQLVHVTPHSHLLPRASPSLNQTRSLPLLRSKSTYFPMFIVPTPLAC